MDKAELYETNAYTAIVEKEAELSPSTENMPMAMASGNCFANEMANAIQILNFLDWHSGRINCPGNEVWYKFTANANDVPPNSIKCLLYFSCF